MTDIILEVNESVVDRTVHLSNVMITPMVSPEYWAFRVRVSETQAILGFPKFGTIGVGFERETDWNTNLPCLVEPDAIYEHIKHNKADRAVSKAKALKAIRMVCEAGEAYLRLTNGDADVDASLGRLRPATEATS